VTPSLEHICMQRRWHIVRIGFVVGCRPGKNAVARTSRALRFNRVKSCNEPGLELGSRIPEL
jgi:hypothetical protein